MAGSLIIAASVMLLFGAASEARGDFVTDLREAVELSDEQRREKAGAGEVSKPADDSAGSGDSAPGARSGGESGVAGAAEIPASASGGSGNGKKRGSAGKRRD